MAQEELFALIAEAESGNVESMKQVARIFLELAEKNTQDGCVEQALICLEHSDKWRNELRKRNVKW